MEPFISYQVELEKDKYKEIYDYDYSGKNMEIKDPKIKKLIEGTDIVPILYMGENPYVFINPKTNEKFYYNGIDNMLNPFNERTDPESNYLNSLNMKNKLIMPNEMLLNHNTTTNPEIISIQRNSLLDKQSKYETVVEEENNEEEEEEAENLNNKQKKDNNIAKLMEKMNMTGFTKSFILSLVHELGSKEIKIKYMEDERDNLTDEDFNKLHSLSHKEEKTDYDIEIVNEEIQEEEQTFLLSNIPKVEFKCPDLVQPKNCKIGTKIITDKKNNCPKLVCDKTLKPIQIKTKEVSDKFKVELLIISIIVIVFTMIIIISFI